MRFVLSLRYLVGFVVVSLLLWLYGSGPSGDLTPFFGWVVLCGVGYLVSLRLHPRRNCWACQGSGRHTGSIFTYARRKCGRCDGNGWQRRWGASVLKIDA